MIDKDKMKEKISYIKNYYKGREESIINVKVIDKGDSAIIQDYEKDIKIKKDDIKICIYGSFLLNCFNVSFVDVKNDYEDIGIPLEVGVGSYDKARVYARQASKALGYKFLEDNLVLGRSTIDKDYFIHNKTGGC
jgi:hypothetical protein